METWDRPLGLDLGCGNTQERTQVPQGDFTTDADTVFGLKGLEEAEGRMQKTQR